MRIRIDGIVASMLLLLSIFCVIVLDGVLHHRFWVDGFARLFLAGTPIWVFVALSGICFLFSLIGLIFRKSKLRAENIILLCSLVLSLIWPAFVGGHYITDKWRIYRDRDYKSTMQCIREWALYWETYYQEYLTYLPPGQNPKEFRWGNISPMELTTMFHSLHGSKAKLESLSAKDAWGWDLQFCAYGSGKDSRFAIRSPGKDGRWDGDSYEIWPWGTGDYDRDIVFANGQWVRWQRGEAAGPGPAPEHRPGEKIYRFPDLANSSK